MDSSMEPNTLTINQAKNLIKKKLLSSEELVNSCLERISKTNKILNSFITIDTSAQKKARWADGIIKDDKDAYQKYPLLGIPVAIKDNFLTKGLRTTASARLLDNFMPQYDATVVQKIKKAGAIILGKTNMDAWAHGSSTETSDYGTTRNPWNIQRSPGGSSGGSAAAVAADQCIFAIGSETAGSVRGPACWCGITGLKPTYGRISRYGVIAMASSTDSPGPLTKDIADALLVTKILAGPDPNDATTINEDWKAESLDCPHGLTGMKIGFPQEYLLKEIPEAVKQTILEAAKILEKLGAKVEQVSLMDPKYSIGVYTILQRSEVSSNLARYDGIRYGNGRETFGEEAKKRIMLGTFSLSTGYYDQYYNKAQRIRTLIVSDFAKCFSTYDAIIGPTMPTPALPIGSSKDQAMFGEMADVLLEASSIAGLTGLSIPCGFVNNIPIGLQITSAQKSEMKVLKIGNCFQNATQWHKRKPQLIK
jgi:aspartyl-tRNA(Asn)/glutamyl-tRNA(Gln) amidotransferase subunit A